MDSFLSTLKQMNAKDKETFVDEATDYEWTLRSDNTGMMLSGVDGKNAVKFTEDHLNACRAPSGFRRKTMEISEEIEWLSKTMEKAAKRMRALQTAIEGAS